MRRTGSTVGLVLLVVCDIGLVVLAVRHVQSQPDGDTPADVSVPVSGDPQRRIPSDRATDEATSESAPRAAPLMMSITEDGTILRAVPGSCETGDDALVSRSTDDGATFEQLTPRLTEVLRLDTSADGLLSIVGADEDCSVRNYTSTDEGNRWLPESADDQWYPDPSERQVVHSPQGAVEPECRVRSLTPIDEAAARVTCLSGVMLGTADAGQSWVVLGRLPNVRAVVYESPGNAFALAPTDDCEAQAYATVDGGDDWEPAGCIPARGIQGLASNGATMVAQVDDEIFQSTDNAQTWSRP